MLFVVPPTIIKILQTIFYWLTNCSTNNFETIFLYTIQLNAFSLKLFPSALPFAQNKKKSVYCTVKCICIVHKNLGWPLISFQLIWKTFKFYQKTPMLYVYRAFPHLCPLCACERELVVHAYQPNSLQKPRRQPRSPKASFTDRRLPRN